MCKIAMLAFSPKVSSERRREVMGIVVHNGWDMGNKDGVGYVSWDVGKPAVIGRAMTPDALEFPAAPGSFALVHVRIATNEKVIGNTHPFELDDAFLIHNGMITVDTPLKEKVEAGCKSTCDSERILSAYLLAGRNLRDGLAKTRGHANVMIWDQKRNVLSVFPDGEEFQFWRQAGVLILCQNLRQSVGIVRPGFQFPYEYDVLPKDRIYEFPLTEGPIDWRATLEAVEASSVVPPERTWVQHWDNDREYASEWRHTRPYAQSDEEALEGLVKLEKRDEILDDLRSMTQEERQAVYKQLTKAERHLLSRIEGGGYIS